MDGFVILMFILLFNFYYTLYDSFEQYNFPHEFQISDRKTRLSPAFVPATTFKSQLQKIISYHMFRQYL